MCVVSRYYRLAGMAPKQSKASKKPCAKMCGGEAVGATEKVEL
jgi:hypothetical protein